MIPASISALPVLSARLAKYFGHPSLRRQASVGAFEPPLRLFVETPRRVWHSSLTCIAADSPHRQ